MMFENAKTETRYDAKPAHSGVEPVPGPENRTASVPANGRGASKKAKFAIKNSAKREPRQIRTGESKRKAAFLRAFQKTFSAAEAFRLTGTDQAAHCHWLATDAEYKAEYRAMTADAADLMENELIHMAINGVFQPVIYQGQIQYATPPGMKSKIGFLQPGW
jgi:hypothetical protein